MSEVRAFLFDFDGVMTRTGVKNDPAARLGETTGLDAAFVRQALWSDELWPPYIRGTLDDKTFWERMQQRLRMEIREDQRNIWSDWSQLQPVPEMIDLVYRVREAGYPAGLLSNATPTTAADLRAHGAYDIFDFAIISCETGGLAKPDREIYERAMAQLPHVEPHEVAYIDDQERCLAPARELGMHAILAQSTPQILADTQALM